MRISTKEENAIKFMLDLSMHNDGTPVKLKNIAQRQNISVKYLEQIVSALVNADLVQSVKGSRGGYMLQYEPKAYTVKSILNATEGRLSSHR